MFGDLIQIIPIIKCHVKEATDIHVAFLKLDTFANLNENSNLKKGLYLLNVMFVVHAFLKMRQIWLWSPLIV